MELTKQQQDFINSALATTSQNILLAGKAGVGKSFVTRHLITLLQESDTPHVVLAPTGVAAINVGGITIHRFFNIVRQLQDPLNLKIAIVDECSMMRADLFDGLNSALKDATQNYNKPFGGVKLILVGDLKQLPPVVTDRDDNVLKDYSSPYFFSSFCYSESDWDIIELTEVKRQEDKEFISILNQLRETGDRTAEISWINSELKGPAIGTVLTGTNRVAQLINKQKLDKLEGQLKEYKAKIIGDFDKKEWPADYVLSLKVGARVICIKNIYGFEDDQADTEDDTSKALLAANGDVGTVTFADEKEVKVMFHRNDRLITFPVNSAAWEKSDMVPEHQSDGTVALVKTIVGQFIQMPLRLAWAITVHKSQGMSLPEMTVDVRDGFFAAGQAYVAFSRATDPAKLRVIGTLKSKDIITCEIVDDFLKNNENSQYLYKNRAKGVQTNLSDFLEDEITW